MSGGRRLIKEEDFKNVYMYNLATQLGKQEKQLVEM
jgi:hypothetical protein